MEKKNQVLVDVISQVVADILGNNDQQGDAVSEKENELFHLPLAKRLAQVAEEKARQTNTPISVAVVDASGNLVLFHRMPKAVTASVDYAQHKAYTAAIYNWPSHKMDELISPPSAMVALTNIDPKVTSLGGGMPIKVNGQFIGGLGISGGPIAQDIEVATAVLEAVFGKQV